jgi:hypothetical protein
MSELALMRPVNGLAGSGSGPNERHRGFPLCKRDGLAYPHVFGVRTHRSKILVRNCKAEDVVTGETCESLGERFSYNPQEAGGFTEMRVRSPWL